MRRFSLKFLTKDMYELFKRDQERRGVSGDRTPDNLSKPSSLNNSTEKWTKSGSLKQKSSRRNPLSLSHESLVMLVEDPMQQKLSSANSVNSIVNHVGKSTELDEVDRVASWAVSFDKLLNDTIGIVVFTDFLKKEFSEENIEFWKTCEDYKTIMNSNFRKSKAQEIYDKYISVRASDAVNVDSVARKEVESQLDNPTVQIFDGAQHQIFQLMKQDKYSRFLKSDLYKSYMMDEMEGKPLVIPDTGPQDKNKLLDKANDKDSKKKGKGKENDENKRRRSLLPWKQKSKKQGKGEDKKSKKETKDINANTTQQTSNEPVPIVTTTKDVVKVEVPATIAEEEPEQPRFCRVIMPDGSTTVVGTKQGQTINYILGKLCEKRGFNIASVDVFLLGNEKPLNLNEDISTLGSKEVTIERRVLFRMDLPNKKSIGVKAKPNRLIKDVFKPILHKYGYKIDTIDVHLSGQTDTLCLDNLVSTIDSQRVIILNQVPTENLAKSCEHHGLHTSSTRPPLPNKFTSKYGHLGLTNTVNNNNNIKTDAQTLEIITNEIFGSVMLDKSDQLLSHNFDELGILDPESSPKVMITEVPPPRLNMEPYNPGTMQQEVAEATTKEPGKMVKSRQKVTFDLKKNTVRRPQDDDEGALCEHLKRAQNLSLDDQRGVTHKNELELPDFLLGNSSKEDNSPISSRNSAPASLGHDKSTVSTPAKRSCDLLSEIDNYIESINENFAAYTRESTPKRPNATLQQRDTRTPISSSDKSFSEDGILPSPQDAEDLFQGHSSSDDVDFDNPELTEKSLTDIGFSYSHNKYLSKSRNFLNQRRKNDINYSPVSVHLKGPPLASPEMLSPNQTLRNELLNQSDLSNGTISNSPSVSPYESDSSLDKENIGKFVPNSSRVQRSSRHTQLHSPSITGDEGDTFLSTIDTDSKLTQSSTAPLTHTVITKPHQFISTNSTLHTDEVTYV
ncbi:termination of G-protein coupled receptor signaling pathway [Mactra antiquata]